MREDPQTPRRHPHNHQARPFQRQDRSVQQQDQGHHPHGLRLPQHGQPHRHDQTQMLRTTHPPANTHPLTHENSRSLIFFSCIGRCLSRRHSPTSRNHALLLAETCRRRRQTTVSPNASGICLRIIPPRLAGRWMSSSKISSTHHRSMSLSGSSASKTVPHDGHRRLEAEASMRRTGTRRFVGFARRAGVVGE